MKILIPGGTGFLGGQLSRQLLSLGHQVIVPIRPKQRIPISFEGYQNVSFNSGQLNFGIDETKNLKAIVYLSGVSSPTVLEDPAVSFEVNSFYPARLLREMSDVGCSHFIYASTNHVNDLLAGKISNETKQDRALRLYAASKLSGETLLEEESSEAKVKLESIRLANCFGPPDGIFGADTNGALNDFCRQAANTGVIVLRSSGIVSRKFTPASSVIKAVCDSILFENDFKHSKDVDGTSVMMTLSEAALFVIDTFATLTKKEISLVIQGRKMVTGSSESTVNAGQFPDKFVSEIVNTAKYYLGT
jgi:nucleoside-diphosphate-sugar epimerase